MRKEFHSLLSLEEARSMVLQYLPAVAVEEVRLQDSLGRVLAERVVSGIDVPGFDRASMDGYALRADDTLAAREDRPVELRLEGRVPMGSSPELALGPGEAAEVSTGSMMPEGADAVVMVEHSEVKANSLLIRRPVHPKENVLGRASDMGFGEVVLRAGTKLTPREIGVLAAVGRERVAVRRLQVGVASTGNELVMPGRPLGPGRIYDINSYTIAAAAEECGASPKVYGILPDDYDALASALEKMSERVEMILVSGSTSAGAGDMLYAVVEEMGELLFHGINLKPGKPTIFGKVKKKPVLGLPGYPTSALTVFGQLGAPAISKALGIDATKIKVRGRLTRPVRSEGRRQMLAVGMIHGRVYPLDKGSGSIITLARADGVMEIPPAVEYIDRGDDVEVQLFGKFEDPALLIAGEDCPALEILAGLLPFRTRLEVNGSRRGLISVKDGLADLASVSFSRYGPGDLPKEMVAIRGYSRELGLIFRHEENFDLTSWGELRVAGWSRDSEMGTIFKAVLKERGAKAVEYTGSARAHSVVAAAVASGKVDVGFCTRGVAEEAGLLFEELGRDEICFAARRSDLKSPAVQALIETLKSDGFKESLPPGTEPLPDTGSILDGPAL